MSENEQDDLMRALVLLEIGKSVSQTTLRAKSCAAILKHIAELEDNNAVYKAAIGQWEQSGEYSNRQLEERDKRIAELEAVLKNILDMVSPCNCHEAYTSRKMIAPDCQYHSFGMEEVEAYAMGALKGEKTK